jgi:hypothetical protein
MTCRVSTLDEGETEVLATYALTGAVVGGLVQVALNDRLYPGHSPVLPRIGVGPDGGFSVGAALRF